MFQQIMKVRTIAMASTVLYSDAWRHMFSHKPDHSAPITLEYVMEKLEDAW